MNNISLYRPDDPYEMLISQMIRIERQPQDRIKAERDNQDRLKNVMSDVDSKLSALHTLVKQFTDTFNSPFQARTANAAADSPFGVTASDSAALGSHTLQILRLASADTRISKQFSTSGTELFDFFRRRGAQTFSIEIPQPTDADPNNVASISVTVDPTGTTDDEILAEIRTAIADAMSDAVTDGTIDAADKAVASVVNETSDTARLSLRSGNTGYDNRLQFTDSRHGLLALLEVTTETAASGTAGGAVVAVGTSETDSELNSTFVLDGLTLYRGTNNVTDALDGITLDLKKAGGDPAEFSVTSDAESIKGMVNDFIKKYNDLLTYIQNKSKVDGTTGVRGDFAGDGTFSGLRYSLRDDISRAVTGQPADAPTALTDLGIKTNKDGTLELSDATKLIAAVEKDAGAVESLFAGDDGVATRLKTRIDQFVGIDGIVDNRKESIDTRLKRLDDQIKDWDDRLAQRESQLRAQFAKMQETIALLQGQQANLNGFFYGGY